MYTDEENKDFFFSKSNRTLGLQISYLMCSQGAIHPIMLKNKPTLEKLH